MIVEYEVREINPDGDAVDVYYAETLTEAIRWADTLVPALPFDASTGDRDEYYRVVALVVEKHESPGNAANGRFDQSTYTTLGTYGDEDALKKGGWKS